MLDAELDVALLDETVLDSKDEIGLKTEEEIGEEELDSVVEELDSAVEELGSVVEEIDSAIEELIFVEEELIEDVIVALTFAGAMDELLGGKEKLPGGAVKFNGGTEKLPGGPECVKLAGKVKFLG